MLRTTIATAAVLASVGAADAGSLTLRQYSELRVFHDTCGLTDYNGKLLVQEQFEAEWGTKISAGGELEAEHLGEMEIARRYLDETHGAENIHLFACKTGLERYGPEGSGFANLVGTTFNIDDTFLPKAGRAYSLTIGCFGWSFDPEALHRYATEAGSTDDHKKITRYAVALKLRDEITTPACPTIEAEFGPNGSILAGLMVPPK